MLLKKRLKIPQLFNVLCFFQRFGWNKQRLKLHHLINILVLIKYHLEIHFILVIDIEMFECSICFNTLYIYILLK